MVTQLNNFGAVVNAKGEMELRFNEFLFELVRQVNQNAPLTGTGSPEGAVKAEPPRIYFDTSAAAGSNLYVKKTGADNTGWQLV